MQQPLALKEWAVTVEALLRGELICVMRKGGIHEETKKFELKAPQFLLMPAFEHQKEHLLKDAYQGRIMETIKKYEQHPEIMYIGGYAEVIEDIEIFDESTLHHIFNHHIWTEQFADERLKWKKTQPLHLLILRVYKFTEELKLDMKPAYTGCKSWISIEEHINLGQAVPVLNDEQFAVQYNALVNSLRK